MFKLLLLLINLLSIAAAAPMLGEENIPKQNLVNNCWSHLSSLSDKLSSDRWIEESKERSRISLKKDEIVKISNLPVIQEKTSLEFQSQPLENLSKDTKKNELPPKYELNDITETVELESPMNELENSKLSENQENIQPLEKPFINVKSGSTKHKDMNRNEETELSNPYSILNLEIEEKETESEEYQDIPKLNRKEPKIKVQSEDDVFKEAALQKQKIENEIWEFWMRQDIYILKNLTALSDKVKERAPSIATELNNLNFHGILEPLLLEANLTVLDMILAAENIEYVLQLKVALSETTLSKATFNFLIWFYMQNPRSIRSKFYTEIGLLLCKIKQDTEITDNERLHKKGLKKSSYLKTLQFIQDVKDGKIDTFNDPADKDNWDLKFISILDEYEQYGKLCDILSTIALKNRLCYVPMIHYLIDNGKSPKKALEIELALMKQNFLAFMNNRSEIANWKSDDYDELGDIISLPFDGPTEMIFQRFFIAIWSFHHCTEPMKMFVKSFEKTFEEHIPFFVYLYHIILSPNSLVNAIRIIHALPYSLKWERIEQFGFSSRYLSQIAIPWQHKIKLEAIRWLIFDILLENQKVSKEIIAKCEEINQLVDGKGRNCKIKASVQSWLMKYDDDRQKSILKELIQKSMHLNQLLADLEPNDKKQRYEIKKITL